MQKLRKSVSILLCVSMILGMLAAVPFEVGAEEVSTWSAIQSAINSASSVTIVLSRDVTAASTDGCITVADGKTVKLDLNGYTLSRDLKASNESGHVIKINGGGTLKIRDSAGNGCVTGGYAVNGGGILNEGTLYFEGGEITENLASDKGGAVYNKGTVEFYGGGMIKNAAKYGGGIYNDAGGTVTLRGSAKVKENKTTENFGGGIANLGNLSVSEEAVITGNFAYTSGGGVWTGSGGSLTLTGGGICGNIADVSGSGVCVEGSFSISGYPIVSDNAGDDVFLPNGKKITVTGALQNGARIGVTSQSPRSTVTSGYRTYNSASPSAYFYENDADGAAHVVLANGEVRTATEGLVCTDRYWDDEAQLEKRLIRHISDYRTLGGSESRLSDGDPVWNVVTGSVTINSRLEIYGTKKLLLCDGAKLNCPKGIRVLGEFDIYAGADGSGELKASIANKSHAAIGGNDSESGGTIKIYGGKIIALASTESGHYNGDSAAIGGGKKGESGYISIYGGDIEATGSTGIGSGLNCRDGSSYSITVYGGKIKSNPDNEGAAVGGGRYAPNPTINILGGRLRANASRGAGIGSGWGANQGGAISISNCYVYAESTYAAAIGGGAGGSGGFIDITNSTVEAVCFEDSQASIQGGYGAGIGGGKGGSSGFITIKNSFVGGSSNKGAGIGGGESGEVDSITIEDSCVVGRGCSGGAGIGGGDGKSGGNITILRSNVVAVSKNEKSDYGFYQYFQSSIYSQTVSCMMEYDYGSVAFYTAGNLLMQFMVKLFAPNHSGAAIGGGDSGNSGIILIEDSVVEAKSGNYSSAMGGGDEGRVNNVTIRNSSVIATSGKYGAAIGSGDESGGNDTINIIGSTVTATAGAEGAGIGGGNEVSGGTINIIDSTVTATGGKYAAGIGGGDAGSGGTIDITDSTVTAKGGKDAAGIGGGEGGNGGTVSIYSSVVNAEGNHYGAGIGCGESGSSAEINIYGSSTVEATAGGSGNARAVGTGDYVFRGAEVWTYIATGLLVYAGNKSSDTQRFTGKDRYNAVWNSKYAKIIPCDHTNVKWTYENSGSHKQKCLECDAFIGDAEPHTYDSDNVCTVCGAAAVMVTLTLVEKNTTGEEVITEIEVPKYTVCELPECANAPENTEFIGWFEGYDSWYDPGSSFIVRGDRLEAVYLPVTDAQYIDSSGKLRTVRARQLNTEVNYLPEGWYVADSDLDYSGKDIITDGTVNLILADGVTVDLNSYGRCALNAKSRLSNLCVYGQSEQSGRLSCGGSQFRLANFRMCGGSIDIEGLFRTILGSEIERGALRAERLSPTGDGVSISGGSVETESITTASANLISWTELTDSIKLDSINTDNGKGSFTVAEAQAFTDGENIYTGTLTTEQVAAIQGKTLTPYLIHHFDEPEWSWSADNGHASALFVCSDDGCDYETELDAEITVERLSDSTVYTARVFFYGTEYQGVKTVLDHEHSAQHVDAVIPSAAVLDDNGEIKNGNIEYWYCPECGGFFEDADCNDEITEAETVLPYFTFNDNGEYVSVVKYCGGDAVVTVPDTVPMNYPAEAERGKTVTSVNHYAFEYSSVTSVTMGDSISMIGWHAFNGCGELEEVFVGSGFNYMYSEAFNNCPALLSFTSTTRQTFAADRYYNSFTNGTDSVTVYGYHGTSLQSMASGAIRFIGLDRHSEPTWSWADDHESAAAEFNCYSCSYRETLVTDRIEADYREDKTIYTATVSVGSESYSDTTEGAKRLFTFHSLSLNGDIGVNFYLNLSAEQLAQGVRVDFACNGKSSYVMLDSTAVKDSRNDCYKATCYVCAAEMNDDITASITVGGADDPIETETYRVRTYADVIIANEGDKFSAELITLVKTLLNYGAGAQTQFTHNIDNLANAGVNYPLVGLEADEISGIEGTVPSKDSIDSLLSGAGVSIEYYGCSLILKTKTTLRFYFKKNGADTSQLALMNGNGINVGTVENYNNSYCYIDVSDIAASNLSKCYELKFGNTSLGSFSALSYAKDVLLNDNGEQPITNTVTALYRYNEAAVTYFNSIAQGGGQ